MSALTLYEMSEKYKFLVEDLCDSETGELNDESLDKLNSITDSIQDKCIAITKVFKSIELTQEAIKFEKERLAKREASFKEKVTRLKDYLQKNMEKCEIKKIECAEFTISLQKNPPAVQMIDENLIPMAYEKVAITKNIAKIRDDLLAGKEVPGAILVTKNSVRIK